MSGAMLVGGVSLLIKLPYIPFGTLAKAHSPPPGLPPTSPSPHRPKERAPLRAL